MFCKQEMSPELDPFFGWGGERNYCKEKNKKIKKKIPNKIFQLFTRAKNDLNGVKGKNHIKN